MRSLSILSTLALLSGTVQASSQPMHCAPRDRVLGTLAKMAQTRQAIGLAGSAVMEVFADADSAHWTITVTFPDGRMCLLANGSAYEGGDELAARGIPS